MPALLETVVSLLADASIKTLLLCGCAFGVTRALRHSGASLRHLVWSLTLLAALALPLGTRLLPDMTVRVLPAGVASPPVPLSENPERGDGVLGLAATTRAVAPEPIVAPVVPETREVREAGIGAAMIQTLGSWRGALLLVWLAGAAFVLFSIVVAMRRLRRIERIAGFVDDPAWLALAREVAAEIGLRRRVRLLWNVSGGLPMTWGAWRPVVLLPPDAATWSESRRRDVLRHELAHVDRWDFVTQLVARVVCAIYWFLPPVWLAARAARLERERACDDHVLRHGSRPSRYAEDLLALARELRPRSPAWVAGIAFARPSQLADRLVSVLDPHARRERTTAGRIVLASVAAALVWWPIAAIAPGRQVARVEGRAADVPATTSALDAAPSASRSSTSLLDVVQSADTLAECKGSRNNSSSSRTRSGDVLISTEVGRCRVSLEANGKVRFNADFTDIVSIEPGGRVQIETDDGEVTKRLVLRAAASGSVERRFTVDGDEQPYDPAWLAATLLHLLRNSGYAADERAAAIIARGGVAGLLAELEYLHSDYTMRRYIEGGLKAPGVDLAGKQQLVQRGARSIESDYELAELLIAATKLRPRSRELWSTITTAAERIASSYERRRVLSSALKDSDVDEQIAKDVLTAAGGIESDYELAELLIDVQRSQSITPAIRPAFVAAVGTIASDYERRRVLTPATRAATAEVLTTAVELAGSMSSDYELAELLIAVGPRVSGSVVRPYFAAVSQIASDYEKRRTLEALLRRQSLDSTLVGEVLRASQTMGSDYERAELLIHVARGQRLEGKVRELYLDAADGIHSQYEQDRALAALARRRR